MSDESRTRDEWLQRVLGVNVPRKTPSQQDKAVRFAPRREIIQDNMPRRGAIDLRKANRNIPIDIQIPPRPEEFVGKNGVKVNVTRSPQGRTLYTAPPPPVGEITFSGGGAKGAALPGAVRALQDSGVLKGAKKIAGASVGSMTAALVAAGITADEFEDIGNSDETTDVIVEGSGGTKKGLLWAAMKNKATGKGGNPLTGQGLENIVRDVLDETLRKRMLEYIEKCGKSKQAPAQEVLDISKRLASNKSGPTFLDLRTLSKFIPEVKEVVITGTYIEEFVENDKGKLEKLKGGNKEGQLYVFDADSEPKMEIAVAVHASASFPVAFKPVDIKLASGLTVRFIDGGVMNNTPTSSSLDTERKLDPVPQERGITFVFESKSGTTDNLLKGKVSPSQGKKAQLVDWFLGADHNASEYAKNKDMTDRPEEIVVVPLQVELPPKKPGGKNRKIDMRDGTLNFGLELEAKVKLQEETEKATHGQIDREKAPKTREFANDSQMFVCIPLSELAILADSGFPGAAAAMTFRERVAEMITKLKDAMKQARATDKKPETLLDDKNARMALDELDIQAGDNVDFQGHVARELNKHKDLDALLAAARGRGLRSPALKAGYAVADAVKAHDFAGNILKNLVYPKMKREPEGGAGILTLLTMEQLLRKATAPRDVNEAITLGVNHFRNKSDKAIPRRGHKKFAKELDRRRMPA